MTIMVTMMIVMITLTIMIMTDNYNNIDIDNDAALFFHIRLEEDCNQ